MTASQMTNSRSVDCSVTVYDLLGHGKWVEGLIAVFDVVACVQLRA